MRTESLSVADDQPRQGREPPFSLRVAGTVSGLGLKVGRRAKNT